MDTIEYNTKDSKGHDIVKHIKIKKYDIYKQNFCCPICNKNFEEGVRAKDIVSSKFTDWQYIGNYICENCADLFSLYFYNYIVNDEGIHLYNIRELENELTKKQKTPFMFVITTTQKKHLFYRSRWNYNPDYFCVNLETEIIYTTNERMKKLFDFVCSMQRLGCSKNDMKEGIIKFDVLKKVGYAALKFLRNELQISREIQIPLYCGQKREISEEDAICCITSILKV